MIAIDQECDRKRRTIVRLRQYEIEEVGDRPARDAERSVHIRLAELQLGIRQDREEGEGTLERNFDRLTGAVADLKRTARRRGHPQGSSSDKPS